MPLSVFPFQRVFTRDRKGFYHVFRFDIDRRLSFAFVGHGKLLMPFRRSYGIWEYTEYSMLCTMYFFLVSYRSLQCSPRWKTTWFGVRYNNNNWPCYKNGMQTTKLCLPWYIFTIEWIWIGKLKNTSTYKRKMNDIITSLVILNK